MSIPRGLTKAQAQQVVPVVLAQAQDQALVQQEVQVQQKAQA